MASEHSLELKRVINAPIDKVYDAWTNVEQIINWWGPNGVSIEDCEIDAVPNGKIYLVMVAGSELGELAGSHWPMRGEFIKLSRPTKVVYTASPLENDQPIMNTTNSLTLKELEVNKTELQLNITVSDVTEAAKMALAGMEVGWNQSLDKLSELVES